MKLTLELRKIQISQQVIKLIIKLMKQNNQQRDGRQQAIDLLIRGEDPKI